MKRVLSLLLSFAVAFGVFVTVSTLPVLAEADKTGEVWTPTEILLYSKKEYKNPYYDVDIDAEFTHTDGTTIKLPGFWKEGQTFAVRFSPTKTGMWSYKITSSDASNEKLNVSGVLEAAETTATTQIAKHGFVSVENGNRYYTYADGTPFFWLGDTNWQAPNYVKYDACNFPGCHCGNQFKHEVDNRASKGFNVYQTYFDTAISDGGGQSGYMPSLWKTKYTLPNVEVFNNKIDKMFAYLLQKDMVCALGLGVHTNTVSRISEKDFLRFTRYIVGRYACYSIVWISGQEITNDVPAGATPDKTVLQVYMDASSLISQLDGYQHPNGAHMYPMIASDKRAQTLNNADWHKVWILQGGHGKHVQSVDFYRSYYVLTNKPMIEGEANYEDINCGGFTGYDANRYCAWTSVLRGCCGFTYGVTGIWANCYSNERDTGWLNSYSYEPWFIGLDKPGSYEVAYMKQFFENLPDWTKLVPGYDVASYSSFAKEGEKVLASTEDKSTVVVYFRNNDLKTGMISCLDPNGTYTAYWFNPLTGKYIVAEKNITGNAVYTVPDKPTANDWVFVLTTGEIKNIVTENVYADMYSQNGDNTIEGNIIEPFKVTAIGGCMYSNGKLVDNTDYLYDLNGDTAWKPYSDRTSQTIIYDLGCQYDLKHIAITPQKGTTLPKYRIEVSRDGSDWTIMANASIRDMKWSDDKTFISEKLTGEFRYVKILLLNAEDIPDEEAKKADYEVVFYSADKKYFSHTAIAEISVFGNKLPEDAPADSGNTEKENVEVNEPADSTENTVKPEPIIKKEGISTAVTVAVIAGGAVIGIAAGVIVATVIKKKKSSK